MFTGIVEEIGVIRSVVNGPHTTLVIQGKIVLEDLKPGNSVAVSGVCLTAVVVVGREFTADISPETMRMTTLGTLTGGSRVNLERAMRLNQRIDGHLVSGHVDGIGTIDKRDELGNAILFDIGTDEGIRQSCIEKGSIAVDGVSLTVNDVTTTGLRVSIIPHTAALTTLGSKRVGDRVNVECDMIGKYVARLLATSGYRRGVESSGA